ncbi:hypothetical protein CARUB_v10015606mg [Capsella rubella]|uniref:Uroporphyrinogen decarboxylase n=1 Tax=Capsella rubella TaxID=81985 RepID=R0HRC3_9BRAS|nr:hypothetical protein CARUB_v10015606mg [Capsella rubella]
MTSLLIFFFFAVHSLSTVAADLHETRSRFKPPQFSPLFVSPSPQTVTQSPTRYFEVQKPPVPNLPTSQPPCSYHVLHHDFAYTYTKPPVLANYTLPSHCSSRDFSKIVLEFKSTSQRRQFDRIFGIWLDGVEILRSCTAEPRPNGIVWSVEKDNLDDSSSGYSSHQADMILPISRNLPLNDGLWFEIVNPNGSMYKEFEIPRNVYRAVLEVYVSFHENDEFWYGNLPNDFVTANNLTAAGNGPFREVVVSLDGHIAGAVWPFPVVFTGGINPLLWRPITAIGSFDLPTYDIEITPFLGSLLDEKTHKLGFSVTNALNVWYIDANLHLWLDQEREIVEGKVLEFSRSSVKISSVSHFKGLNGNFTTKANRSITSIGLVKSSHGDIITNATQKFSYVNKMVVGKDMSLQIIDQLIQADDHIHAKRASREVYSANSIKTFPFYLYSDSEKEQNNTSLEIANVTIGFNEERSESDNGLVRIFKSKLENKQEGQGVIAVKNHLVTNGYGSTQQVYNYVGSDQCYFRNISSHNYTILYDQLETLVEMLLLRIVVADWVSIESHQCGIGLLSKKTQYCCSEARPFSHVHILFSIVESDPLLVKAAKGQAVSRPPAWMMRQAGRYMAVYQKLAKKHPSFRERSENTDLIVEISLQPWQAFRPDGVIIFSDILTPLPAFGVPFDIEDVKGPVIQSPIRTEEDLKRLHPIDFEKLQFVGDSLKILRQEVGEHAAVLGFVGAPWTIATYIVEGGTTRTYTVIKNMCHTAPNVLRALLSHLTKAITEYVVYQVEHGAHCIQIFDSWGGQLTPEMWERWSKPYIEEIIHAVKKRCPDTPVVFYINGNGGLLERMKGTGADVIGLDWTVDMADGRRRLGSDVSVQGNVDPAYLFSPLPALTEEILRVVKCAGPKGHILNLGHGVLVGTPEEAVAHFFETARSLDYQTVFQNHIPAEKAESELEDCLRLAL